MFKPNNKPNNRFNFLADELHPEINTKKNVKDNVKVNNKENTFLTSTSNSNSRFDMAKLTDESYLDTMNTNTRDNYSRNPRNSKNMFNNMSQLPVKPHVIPFEYKEEYFPGLIATNKDNIIKEQIIIESDYKNAIKKEIEEPETQPNTEQNVKIVVEMGMVLITKDKFGKKVAIYGPKSEEQKRKHFLDNDLNHQMNLSILRMEERWITYKQIYDENHGQNAFEEKYGYEAVYDESYEDENDDSESESDYESE